jgi:hypothetical protein
LSFIITGVTATATSKERLLLKSSGKSSLNRQYYPPGLKYLSSRLSQMATSPLFDSFEVTESWIFSESISRFQGTSFTPMSGPESLLPCTTSKFTLARSWCSAYPTSCLPFCSLNLKPGYRCIDTSRTKFGVIDVLAFAS